MRAYTLTHLGDAELLRALGALVSRDRAITAALLAHIAEVDVRRLYLPAAYSSMHAYCIGELRLSEDAAYKRIQAARAARHFPVLFDALADGRLHLAAVCLLAPHLAADNADELVAAATHCRKSEIEELLARRFAPPALLEAPAVVRAVAPVAVSADPQLAPGQVGAAELAPGQVETPPARFLLQVTIGKATREKLRHAQALLGHAVPSGDVEKVLDRALDALIRQLEKRKFAATSRPRRGRASRPGEMRPRLVPAPVRRAVWLRDEGRCTFVSGSGRRCGTSHMLEFDHVEPVARGGRATVDGMRLRCRSHNQFEAERVFGANFMERKRGLAQADATADVIAALRALGLGAQEARRAAEASAPPGGDVSLEARLRAALQCVGRRAAVRPRDQATATAGLARAPQNASQKMIGSSPM